MHKSNLENSFPEVNNSKRCVYFNLFNIMLVMFNKGLCSINILYRQYMISLLVFFSIDFLNLEVPQVRCNLESFIFNISLRNGIQRSNPVDMSVTPRRRPFNSRWEHIGSMGYTQSSMARYSGVVVEPTHLKHMSQIGFIFPK